MISQELYLRKMGEAILLTGSNLKKPAQDLIYDRICKNYTNDDLVKVMEDVTESDTLKLSYPLLVRRLNYHRMIRREQEEEKAKAQDLEEVKKFWSMEGLEDDCLVRKCYSCSRRRCDTMARACIAGMDAMIKGEIALKDLLGKLAKDFPGAGFDGPVTIDEYKKSLRRRAAGAGKSPGPTGGGGLSLVPPPDPDFPHEPEELELPHDAYQGTLSMDRPTGGDA